jgi:predicted nucleic acid-binding protein
MSASLNPFPDQFFVDTNVLLYRFAAGESQKQPAAELWIQSLWSHGAGRISWQIIFEFYANAVRKAGIPVEAARKSVQELMMWHPEPPLNATLERAWHWCDHAQINFWDALIVAAAEQSGCRWLLTEDLQAGQTFGSVTVINPFQSSPGEFGLA